MINDKFSQNFVNRRLRPLAEKARSMSMAIDDIITSWDTQNLSNLMVNSGSEVFEDDRADEGVLPLTGADINAFIMAFRQAKDFLSQPEIQTIMQRFCVRPVDIN